MTQQITFSIDKQIFDSFPEYRRAILVVSGADNKQASALGEAITKVAQTVKDAVSLEDPRIVAWREAFATLGIKVHDFRPSVDALVRRIHNDKPLGSINPIVDLGTVISLEFVLPAGAHPILSDTADVRLGIATGQEVELSDGAHPNESVPAAEPILLDNERVATRRWVWRQTSQSRINGDTHNFYLNIDALGVIDEPTLQAAVARATEIIASVLGKGCQTVTLSAANPEQVVKTIFAETAVAV
jgi:DNA/RNA-binding domain of Phe-tRNA-synthetase-like protein